MKELKNFYRITIWSHYEEDEDEPFTIDFISMEDALNAMRQYENELTLSGQKAYSVCGPDVVEAYV